MSAAPVTDTPDKTPTDSSKHSPLIAGRLLVLLGFVALIIYFYFGMYWVGQFFPGPDRENFEHWVQSDFAYESSLIDNSAMSPVQGMGGLIQPIGVWLNPAYVIPHLFPSSQNRSTSYFAIAILLALATYALANSLGLPKILSLLSAQIVSIFSFSPMYLWTWNFTHINGCYLYQTIQGLAVPASTGLLFLAAFVSLGTVSKWKNIACILLLPIILTWSSIADPLYTAVFWLPIGLFAAAVYFGSGSKRVFAWRSAGAIFCLVFAAAIHLISFYHGLIGYAARARFPNEAYVEVQQWDNFTALFFQGTFAAALVTVFFIATIVTFLFGKGPLRGFAAGVAIFIVAIIAASLVEVFSGIHWNLPLPTYYEIGAEPCYVIAAFAGGWIAWQKLSKRFHPQKTNSQPVNSPKRIALLSLCVLLLPAIGLACIDWKTAGPHPDPALDSPDKPVGVLAYIADRATIGQGGRFNGSVASMLGVPGGNAANAQNIPSDKPFDKSMINFNGAYFRTFDPHLYMTGLWNLHIPTLEDNNHLVTPPFYYLISRALSRPQDYHSRNWAVISKIDPKLMAALGTRFLLDDRVESSPLLTLRDQQTNHDNITIYLYELANPNLGNYSPTHTLFASSAAQTLKLMQSDSFDFQSEAIVYDQPTETFVKSDSGEFYFENGGVRIKAKSSGKSLLVVPIQFSNSLQIIEGADRSPTPIELIRVNLLETGIVFQGDLNIKIAHIFGPFRRTAGRLQDIEDCIRLGIKEDGTIPYPPDYQPLAKK